MAEDPDRLSDDDFERALARSRRRLPVRLAVAGVLAVLGGLGLAAVGHHYQQMQEGSRVTFMMPVQLLVAGLLIASIGALFLLIAAFLAFRRRAA